jgi:hypothetical protein
VPYRLAIVWRGDHEAWRNATPQNDRYHRIFETLAESTSSITRCGFRSRSRCGRALSPASVSQGRIITRRFQTVSTPTFCLIIYLVGFRPSLHSTLQTSFATTPDMIFAADYPRYHFGKLHNQNGKPKARGTRACNEKNFVPRPSMK